MSNGEWQAQLSRNNGGQLKLALSLNFMTRCHDKVGFKEAYNFSNIQEREGEGNETAYEGPWPPNPI